MREGAKHATLRLQPNINFTHVTLCHCHVVHATFATFSGFPLKPAREKSQKKGGEAFKNHEKEVELPKGKKDSGC